MSGSRLILFEKGGWVSWVRDDFTCLMFDESVVVVAMCFFWVSKTYPYPHIQKLPMFFLVNTPEPGVGPNENIKYHKWDWNRKTWTWGLPIWFSTVLLWLCLVPGYEHSISALVQIWLLGIIPNSMSMRYLTFCSFFPVLRRVCWWNHQGLRGIGVIFIFRVSSKCFTKSLKQRTSDCWLRIK